METSSRILSSEDRHVDACVAGGLTERGALSLTDVDPEAEAVRSPGMEMGSGDRVRVWRTAGASGRPQFFQSKPRICPRKDTRHASRLSARFAEA